MDDDEEIPNLVEVLDNVVSDNNQVLVDDDSKKIPITILTGFLGAGKTTLLTYILSANHQRRIAVIENELSMGMGIETLIAKSGVTGKDIDGFFELNNGCICCSVKDDLLTTLEQLVKHSDKFDYILIEMTGVANPGPVISNFWLDDGLHSSLRLDGIICVVDGLNINAYLASDDTARDVTMQICYADRILINKCDLISDDVADKVEAKVRGLNGLADITRTSMHTKPSVDWILDINGYTATIDQVESRGIFNLDPSSWISPSICKPCGSSSSPSSDTRHLAAVLSTHGIRFPGHLDSITFQRYLDSILYRGSYGSTTHSSSNENTSVIDESKVVMEIFRIKGVVKVKDEVSYYVLQGVHDTFELKESNIVIDGMDDTVDSWNKIVVIGKHIDAKVLEDGFKTCCNTLT